MQISDISTSDGLRFLHSSTSPGGSFLIAWEDGDGNGLGGARSSGKGRYWLFRDGKEIIKGRLERPNRGSVSDSGNFCIEDWLFTDELKSMFHCYASDGGQLIKKRLRANLADSLISPSGKYALCYTAASKDEKHSSKLSLFDLTSGQEIWSVPPPFWPDKYIFSENDKALTIRPTERQWIYESCTYALVPPKAA